MSDITRLLEAVRNDDSSADAELLDRIYEELRELARSTMARE